MTFANVNVNQQQLTLLSQLLLTAFPGCTIHQSRDPMRAVQRLSTYQVDVIFADADTCPDLIRLLRRKKSGPPICLLCRQDLPPTEDTDGIQAIVTYPITQQKIQTALRTESPESLKAVV